MRKQRYSRRPDRPAIVDTLPLADLRTLVTTWLLRGQAQSLSPTTTALRRTLANKLLWFLEREQLEECGPSQVLAFFAYLATAHETPAGRWDDPERGRKPLRPVTVRGYYDHLASLWAFAVEIGDVDQSPMATLPPPAANYDQIQPFTDDQVLALLEAARHSRHRRRDVALVLFMLDTAARASEVCSLTVADVDLTQLRCQVMGKGRKRRSLPFGQETARALFAYLRAQPAAGDEPLFRAGTGANHSGALTRSGLLQLFQRLGQAAGIEATRCSPHTMRHTAALNYLTNEGGDAISLQRLMGHTTLEMTNRYLAISGADVEAKHRRASPADNLLRRRGLK